MRASLRLRAVAALGTSLLLASTLGCSGGDDGDSTSTSGSAASSVAPTVTEEPTSTTEVTATTDPATTTTEVPGPVYPLTGLPVTDPTAAARPAMVVKIDNNIKARPQSGLNAADIVFEEIVEVQTRFAAVFHSRGSDPVGPIRSGRTQDVDLLGSFNQPLFVWSGGNPGVTRVIGDSDLVDLSALKGGVWSGGGFYRADDRPSPHDEYAQSSMLWSLAPPDAGPPPQQFQYRDDGETADGEPAIGTDGDMDGLAVEWRYDPDTDQYARTNGGQVHSDALSGPITSQNVIVMVVVYRPSPVDARSPEAQTIGSGEALVFTGGVLVRGTWTRTDRYSPITLTDAGGNPILLTPGRTWVELARAGTFETVI
jgi:hypothetical protein